MPRSYLRNGSRCRAAIQLPGALVGSCGGGGTERTSSDTVGDAASCTSLNGTPASRAAVMNACLSVCGPTFLLIPARLATRRTIRPAPCRSRRRPSAVRKIGPSQRSPVARSIARAVRGASGMGTTFAALTGGRQGTGPTLQAHSLEGRGVGFVVQPRAPDVRGRGVIQDLFFDRVPVEPGDGGQPPGDGGAGATPGFQVAGKAFDIGAADGERGQGTGAAPGS